MRMIFIKGVFFAPLADGFSIDFGYFGANAPCDLKR